MSLTLTRTDLNEKWEITTVKTISSNSSDPISKEISNDSELPTSISCSKNPTKENIRTSSSDALIE